MRLPTADPARGVQSLGRRDPRRAMRVAGMQARAAEYEGATLMELGKLVGEVGEFVKERQDQEEVVQYNRAIAEAQTSLDTLAFRLKNKDTLNVGEVPGLASIEWDKDETVQGPDGTPIQQPRATVPTDEVANQLFAYESEQIYQAARANIKGTRALAKFDTEWAKSANKARLAVTLKNMERSRDRRAIELETHIDQLVQQGSYERAHEALAHGVHTNVWKPDRAASLRRRIDSHIAERAAAVGLTEANTEDALAEYRALVMATPQLDPEDQLKYLNAAHAKESRLRTEYEKRTRDAGESIVADTLLTHLTEGMTWSEVQDRVAQLKALGQGDKAVQLLKNYDTVHQRFEGDAFESEPAALGDLQRMVANVAFPEEGRTVQEEAARVRRQLISALSNRNINPEDFRSLDNSLRTTSQLVYDQEAYRAAKRAIWVDVAGMSPDEFRVAMREAGTDRKLAARLSAQQRLAQRAEENLRAYIEGHGVKADPEGWWAGNRGNYDVTTYLGNRTAGFLEQFPSYVPAEGVDPNSAEGQEAVRNAILTDPTISDREKQRRWKNFEGIER